MSDKARNKRKVLGTVRGIVVRLYPNNQQTTYLNKTIGSCRFIYNQCLAKKMSSYETTKHLPKPISENLSTLKKHFQDIRDTDYPWLKETNTKVITQSIIDLMSSYTKFFNEGKGFPKFKKKSDKNSFRFPLEAISSKNIYSDNKVTFTKDLGAITFSCSHYYKDLLTKNKSNILSATVTKNKSGDFYVSFLVDVETNNDSRHLKKDYSKRKDNVIGIDLGIKTLAVTSSGKTYESIKTLEKLEKQIIKLQRSLSRKDKGSVNREKTRIKLAKKHLKMSNIKKDYYHKVTTELINENQVICLESLNVKGMLKNHNLAKSIQKMSFFEFKRILKYKADWNLNRIVEIDRFFPSSKKCNCCGNINNNLKLQHRNWTCDSCFTNHDRDFNASVNIKNEGYRILQIELENQNNKE